LAYPYSNDNALSFQTEPAYELQVESPVLSLSTGPSFGYGVEVVTTARASAELFSMEDDDRVVCSWYLVSSV
jgi:hypothetical protein